ncbi:MAG: alpha/beta hydrolase [Oscillospiraceae bacterium]|nr:alpha/beta hydrolase [Oscillospiraceae bacterium]
MTICGQNIHCTAQGSGPPLLFLHGWGVGHEVYMPLLRHLGQSFTVWAPDLPGFGTSAPPDVAWDAGKYAGFVGEFCAVNSLVNPVCIGHSNGGRILLKLLGSASPAIAPSKLVLIDSAGIKPKRPLSYYIKVYGYKAAKILLKPFPEIREKYISKKGSEDYRRACPVMRATMSKLLAEDLTPVLHLVKPPPLLIWGEGDTATPLSDAKKMEKLISGAGVAALPGGHWAFLEQLPATCKILDSFFAG